MPEYAALVEAETWSAANVVASVVLLIVVIGLLVWILRRYLAD